MSRKIIHAVWDIKGRTNMQYYNFGPSFVWNLEIRYESLKRSTECVLYIYFVLYKMVSVLYSNALNIPLESSEQPDFTILLSFETPLRVAVNVMNELLLIVVVYDLLLLLLGAFCFSGCPVYRRHWGVRSSGIISSLLLFRLSFQMKELVVVYVEIEPFAVLLIRIVHNEIYLSSPFFRFLCRFRLILRQQNPLCKQYRSTAINYR